MPSVFVAENGALTKKILRFSHYFSKSLESGHHIYELIMLNNVVPGIYMYMYVLNICLLMMSDNVRLLTI